MADSVDVTTHDVLSILSSPGTHFLLKNNADQVGIDSLKGKKIGFYFSASWCGPCRRFTPTLIEVYNELSIKGDFEVVFVSADDDDDSFKSYFSKMPWLAIPFSDSETRDSLNELFHVNGIPHLALLDETGKVVVEDGFDIIRHYATEVYPFTAERIKEIEEKYDDIAKGWPGKVKHETHEHELVLTRRRIYGCDDCNKEGHNWSYFCDDCDFDLHPNCALGDKGSINGAKEEEKLKDGFVCDGDVCTKA